MSSTNRGGQRETSDYYKTPVDKIIQFFHALQQDCGPFDFVRHILDPCAGGTIDKETMSYPEAIMKSGMFPNVRGVDTLDIRPDSPAVLEGDYLKLDNGGYTSDFQLIITNPPFSHALPIIRKALREVKPDLNRGGYVVMLLRLNFLGSESRQDLWRENPPHFIYVHAKRMGFLGHRTDLPTKTRNATDSIEYAHFVWWTGHKPNDPIKTQLRVI